MSRSTLARIERLPRLRRRFRRLRIELLEARNLLAGENLCAAIESTWATSDTCTLADVDQGAPIALFDVIEFNPIALPVPVSIPAPKPVIVPTVTVPVSGLEMLADCQPGGAGSFPVKFTTVGGATYFATYNCAWGQPAQTYLWKTDGTALGTVQVKSLDGCPVQEMVAVGNSVYFLGTGRDGHTQLWRSDGTEAGTVLVKRDWPSPAFDYYGSPRGLVGFNGALYFSLYDPQRGWQLWKSDGTEAGTVPVKDIPGLSYTTAVGGTLYCMSGGKGTTLWRSDGTAEGTAMVREFPEMLLTLAPVPGNNGAALFAVRSGMDGAMQLWQSDGTEAGTVLVKQFSSPSWQFFYRPVTTQGASYFTDQNRVLWRTDGTDAGTYSLLDAGDGRVFTLAAHGGMLFYATSDDSLSNFFLWQTDGTAAGTQCLGRIGGDDFYWTACGFAYYGNGRLYFAYDDGVDGKEPWSVPVSCPADEPAWEAAEPPLAEASEWAPVADLDAVAAAIAMAMAEASPETPLADQLSVARTAPTQDEWQGEPAIPVACAPTAVGDLERRDSAVTVGAGDGVNANRADSTGVDANAADGNLGNLTADLRRALRSY